VRESRSLGSVRGAVRKDGPYRDYEWPAARPGPHTVGEIAKDLGRSAGAVGNALTTLADRAEAARITGKPLRYEANSATAAAAADGQRGQVAAHQNPATTVLFCHSGT
jgi:hypothetical protein